MITLTIISYIVTILLWITKYKEDGGREYFPDFSPVIDTNITLAVKISTTISIVFTIYWIIILCP